jgi:hypothetical protein
MRERRAWRPAKRRGSHLEYPKANRQAEARERGKIGQRAIDLDEHVFVDRLIEAVTTRAERGDDCTEDLRRRRRKMS